MTSDVVLPPGIIDQVDVQFPAGCVGLVHTFASRGGSQVWPSNPSGSFSANGNTITWRESYALEDAPFLFRLTLWNEDDTFEHVITWRFGIRPLPTAARQAAALAIYNQSVQVLEV